MTSDDGQAWVSRTGAAENVWQSITYGDGLFVAVASSGTDRVMTSPDGISWTMRTVPDGSWKSVKYGNGTFVAVASTGTNLVMTSTDGEVWTAQAAASLNQWSALSYGGGRFVATAISGTGRVMSSVDGQSWSSHEAADDFNWYGLTYGTDTFVAVAQNGSNRAMTLYAADINAGMYFDNLLVANRQNIAPIIDAVNRNTSDIAVLKDQTSDFNLGGNYSYNAMAEPAVGNYTTEASGQEPNSGINPLLFSDIDTLLINEEDANGQTRNIGAVKEGMTLKIAQANGYGLEALITNVFVAGGVLTIDFKSYVSFDDLNGSDTITGDALISVRDTLATVTYVDERFDQASDVLNANLNLIANSVGVVWSNENESLPSYLPNGGAIQTGQLFFNTLYLQLYIFTGGQWLGLL